MTKSTKVAILFSGIMAALMVSVGVVITRDRARVSEAESIRTLAQIEDFARRNGTETHVMRNHLVSTFAVRVRYPVLIFIAREFRWGEEVPGGCQSKVTFFNQWNDP